MRAGETKCVYLRDWPFHMDSCVSSLNRRAAEKTMTQQHPTVAQVTE